MSALGTNLVFLRAAQWQTDLLQGDVAQAFMSGDELDRPVYVIPPREGLAGVEPGSLLKLKRSAYGLADAPRSWWRKFDRTLKEAGWKESRLCRALYYLWNRAGELCGIAGAHVDDFIVTGFGRDYEKSIAQLKKALNWGSWKVNEFIHCGREIMRGDDFDVKVSQENYVANLTPVQLESRRVDQPLSDAEFRATRTLLGGLGWLANQSQPQLSYGVSVLLSALNGRDRSEAKRANKLLERVQAGPVTLCFPSGLDVDAATVGVFSDACFGNREDQSSQSGYFLTLLEPCIEKGKEGRIAVLDWSSHKVRRVCRSALSAEAQSATIRAEAGDFLKIVLAEQQTENYSLRSYPEDLLKKSGLLVIDARSVYDFLTSDSGKLLQDKRLALDLRVLQHYMRSSQWGLRWVCGPQMISDIDQRERGFTLFPVGYAEQQVSGN